MTEPRQVKGYLYYCLIVSFALAYASVLTYINNSGFNDHQFYVEYAINAPYLMHVYWSRGILSFLFNEPVWLALNRFLGALLGPEEVIRVFVFISAFITAFVAIRQQRKGGYLILFLLFLLLPQVIKNNIIQLRQGLAIAIFIMGWYSNRRVLRWATTIIAPFIHSSFFFIWVILAGIKLLSAVRIAGSKLSLTMKLLCITAVCILMAMLGVAVAAFLGARQGAGYERWGEDVSGLGFMFWLCILFTYLGQGKDFVRENLLSISVIVFYLAAYFVSPISARVFESALLILLISGVSLTSWRKWSYVTLFAFYFSLEWYQRLGQPLLGWGVHPGT